VVAFTIRQGIVEELAAEANCCKLASAELGAGIEAFPRVVT